MAVAAIVRTHMTATPMARCPLLWKEPVAATVTEDLMSAKMSRNAFFMSCEWSVKGTKMRLPNYIISKKIFVKEAFIFVENFKFRCPKK
jgi:hypothetical protein